MYCPKNLSAWKLVPPRALVTFPRGEKESQMDVICLLHFNMITAYLNTVNDNFI